MRQWRQWRPFSSAIASALLAVALTTTRHTDAARAQTFLTPTGRVDNVRFERVAGGVINIFYDLASDDPGATFAILLEVSLDSGQTFALRPRNVTGDVGPAIAAGLGKKIVWDAGKDVETVQIDQYRIRVTPERGVLRPAPSVLGTLLIVTEPVGAAVTIDGNPRGQTPLTVADLSVGPHQVILAKADYLENRATVTVTAGEVQQLIRTLTPAPGAAAPGPLAKGGSRAKWLIPLAAGGGVAAAVAAKSGGPPPTASLTISPQDPALVGFTVVTFEAARDTSAKAPTFAWDFGDGATGSGATTTHIYDRDGTFTVALTVTDNGASARATGTVTARSLTGTWRPDFHFAPCFTLRLTHTGTRVDAVALNGTAATATILPPRDIQFAVGAAPPSCGTIQFRGQIDATLNSFTVPFSFAPSGTDTWHRQ